MSIRWKLALWNAGAFAVVLTCFALLVYLLLQRALYEQADRLLQSSLALIETDPRVADQPQQRLQYWVEEYREHQGLWCVVYRRDGLLLTCTEGLDEANLPVAPPHLTQTVAFDQTVPGLGRQRVMARPIQLGSDEVVLLLLYSLAPVDEELAHVRSVLLWAGPLALGVCSVLAYGLARQSLAPVELLRQEAAAITADHLDRRLPVPGPDDELSRLARTLNAMIERLERSFAEVRRFTADASHELRTPLTVLRTEIEVALVKGLSGENTRELLEGALEELGRMGRLTEQLLALSRRDAGVDHYTASAVDLHALAAEVTEALRPLAEVKGVLLRSRFDAPSVVLGDQDRLHQALINLVDNAIKYTPSGGTVEVRCGPEAGTVVVEDTGIGIPVEHQPRVFERFYRVDKARSRAEGGTGLGLSIVRSIIQAHGGRLELRSSPGQGTSITITLPRPH